ncbi:MAG: esterase, partial [Glaciecola sp.]
MAGGRDVESREAALEAANSDKAIATRQMVGAFLELCDTEEIAPSKGLVITNKTFTSQPDGNT